MSINKLIVSIQNRSKQTPTKFDSRKYFHTYVAFLFSLFILTDLTDLSLRRFDSFCLSFADGAMTGTYNFASLIVKVILLELASTFSTPPAAKIQCFFHLSFNSILQLINDISSNLQKVFRYF